MTLPRADIGDVDLYLIGEGRHRRLWEVLGAHLTPSGATFRVWAPNARAVRVVGDWNGWSNERDPLAPLGSSGIWSCEAIGALAGHHYKFEIEGFDGRVKLRADPMARRAECPPADASILCAPAQHLWTDDAWLARRAATDPQSQQLRIYEVHAQSWRPGLRWPELADQLGEYVADLGFTHVELLPVMEHPYSPSWGYQVTGFYAPTARLGTPDEFRAFVDAMHTRNIGVILDWVPAHFPRDDWALAKFDGTALFEHADPRRGDHPDWGTHVFNYGRHEVRNFLVANALYWADEFHIDGIRVDAVASMLYLDYSRKPGEWVPNSRGGNEHDEAISFLCELNDVLQSEHPGVLSIAEESTSWPKVTYPTSEGGLGFTHKWNMGWMNDTLRYIARDPLYRSYHHSELTFGTMYAGSEQYVLPLSHDEVVHGKGSLFTKIPGGDTDRFATLRALFGWMWAFPGGKLIFMGDEIAERREWSEIAGVDWTLLDDPRHRNVQQLMRELNQVAVELDLTDGPRGDAFQWLDADDHLHSMYAFCRWSRHGRPVVCITNFAGTDRNGYRVGLPNNGSWRLAIDTGPVPKERTISVEPTRWQHQPQSCLVDVPARTTLWLVGEPDPSLDGAPAAESAVEVAVEPVSAAKALPTPTGRPLSPPQPARG